MMAGSANEWPCAWTHLTISRGMKTDRCTVTKEGYSVIIDPSFGLWTTFNTRGAKQLDLRAWKKRWRLRQMLD